MAIPRKNEPREKPAFRKDAGYLDDMCSGMTKRLAISDGRDGGVKNLEPKKTNRKKY